jgi:hypothetical protein
MAELLGAIGLVVVLTYVLGRFMNRKHAKPAAPPVDGKEPAEDDAPDAPAVTCRSRECVRAACRPLPRIVPVWRTGGAASSWWRSLGAPPGESGAVSVETVTPYELRIDLYPEGEPNEVCAVHHDRARAEHEAKLDAVRAEASAAASERLAAVQKWLAKDFPTTLNLAPPALPVRPKAGNKLNGKATEAAPTQDAAQDAAAQATTPSA